MSADTNGTNDAPHIELTVTAAAGKPGKHLAVATNGVGVLHRDTIDLNSATSRKRFVGATMQVAFKGLPADDWPAGVREYLDARLLAYAAVPPGDPNPPPPAEAFPDDPRVAPLAEMPEDVRAEAEKLLCDPKLAEKIVTDFESVGLVGEKRLAFTIYLVGLSAQLPKPLGAIVRGSSASGKSYTVERVASLFPPEMILHATSITTNALYYCEPGVLRHVWVVAGERSRMEDDDRAEATRALREMLTAGRLSKFVPEKNAEGKNRTLLIEQEGPIAFTETTTLGQIFDEDANRCLLLNTDESEDQTKRVLAAAARAASGRSGGGAARTTAVHHALLRMVPRCDVVIPFAEHVTELYPTARIEARRSGPHLLQLVKAVSLLHFRQRERDDAGRVVATLADYAIAERLARAPFGAAATGVSDGARAYLAALRSAFKDSEFTTTDAQKVGQGSRRTKYNRLTDLNAIGSVEQTEVGKGRVPAKWRLTEVSPEDPAGVLPSVQGVADRLSGCNRAHEP